MMSVAPLYRSTLKKLKDACQTHPHFVHELRFLLSLPVSFDGPHRTVPSSAPPPAAQLSSSARDRPPTERWQTDLTPDELFAVCCEDLRQVIHAHTPLGTAITPASIGQHVSGLRELNWLNQRLGATLSASTHAALELAMSVSAGPSEEDFIPDTAFAKREVETQTRFGIGDPAAMGSSSHTASPTAVADKEKLNHFQLEATPGGTYAMVDEKPSPRGAVDERDAERLYSAGAIGLHREMFVLRHRDAAFLPMRHYFLHGLDTSSAPRETLDMRGDDGRVSGAAATSSNTSTETSSSQASVSKSRPIPPLSQAKIADLATSRLPTVRVARNESVKLTVEVRPFDEEYVNRGEAGIGYFEGAHRQFMVRFRLEALGHQQALRIVNTQFLRLDLALSELVEETGFMHSWDVKSMIQERDAVMGIVSQTAGVTRHADSETTGERGEDNAVTEAAHAEATGRESRAATADVAWPSAAPGEMRLSDHGPEHKAADEPGAPPILSEEPEGHHSVVRDFSLAFVTDSDGPTVMKGLLYYQAAATEEALIATPIHVIAFSHVLLNP